MAQDELDARKTEPLPLADYYDEAAHFPDLTLFDPTKRCQADENGEGEVFISHLEVDVPLHPCSLAGVQVGGEAGQPADWSRTELIGRAVLADIQMHIMLPSLLSFLWFYNHVPNGQQA
jgi:hypothetical protein